MQILEPIHNAEKHLAKLAKLNIHNYWDLALHIPLRYEDLTKVYPIAETQVGQQVMIQGKRLSINAANN